MTGKYHFPDLGEIISFNHHGVIMTFLGKTLKYKGTENIIVV
jgi:hypothetical protein